MSTDNHASTPGAVRFPHTETVTPLDQLTLDAVNVVIDAAMRDGIDAVTREKTLFREAVATNLALNPAAAAELHDRYSGELLDWTLASMREARRAS